jgi:hypothetical protein
MANWLRASIAASPMMAQTEIAAQGQMSQWGCGFSGEAGLRPCSRLQGFRALLGMARSGWGRRDGLIGWATTTLAPMFTRQTPDLEFYCYTSLVPNQLHRDYGAGFVRARSRFLASLGMTSSIYERR